MAKYEAVDYVKVEFKDAATGESEWMWVKVQRASDRERVIFGLLDNEPVANRNLHLGMELAVAYDNVIEHMKASSFGQ